MPQERDDEEQPLRCMANYYDYGPASSTTSNTIARPTTFASRSVPDRMVNYTDIRFDRTRTGYHALQEATRAPQKRKEVHLDLRSTTSPSESTNEHQRSLIAVGEDAPSTKRYKRRSSTFEASRSLSKLDAVVEEVDQLDESDAPTHQIDHQPPSLSTRSSFETEANTTDNPYWKFRKAMRAANEGYQERVQGSRFYGWRMGVLLGTCTSMFVFICNVALLIIGAKTKAGYDRDGIATLMEGDETTISRWNTVCHIFINVLSTILLSASNYTMQILNAPTRAELDSAHRRGKWLDIGLLSVHNLKTISPKRACLCLVLAASSLPLHLFYNAAIFKIITMSDYSVMFLDRNSTMLNGTSGLSNHWIDSVRLETSQWMAVYNRPEVSRYSDLYLVVDQISFDTQVNFGTNVNYTIQDYLPLSLNSTYFINLKNKKPSREGWFSFATWDGLWFGHEPPTSLHVVEGWTLDSGRNSRMQISLYFMVVVLAFNFFKLAIMVGVLLIDTSDEYLVTLGDAAASYLKYPEDLTRGRSTLELDQIFSSFDLAQDADRSTSIWQPRRRRYCSSVGYDKAWSAIIAGSCLVIVLVVFPSTVDVLPDLHSGMWSWGSSSSGAVSFGAKGASAKATIWNAWLSNMPQVLLSLCYLNLNTICTSMASAAEWNHLASSRKGLRVTKPRGEQRSTYFLQLPYKWGVPLVITSGGLHWLLSQAFFLARIDFYDLDGDLERWTSACGISFSALVAFCCVCLLLVLAVRWVGRRHMMPRLPLAENCSLMISAACHPAPDEIDPHLAKVKWGVVTDTGRCSLSAKHVKQPKVGKSYG